jgi:hypothetical protein
VKYRAYIINYATTEARWYETEVEDQYADSQVFSWQENNYSCDCNRHLSFLRAGCPGPPDDPHHNDAHHECGSTAYRVPYIEWEDGRRELIDDES